MIFLLAFVLVFVYLMACAFTFCWVIDLLDRNRWFVDGFTCFWVGLISLVAWYLVVPILLGVRVYQWVAT